MLQTARHPERAASVGHPFATQWAIIACLISVLSVACGGSTESGGTMGGVADAQDSSGGFVFDAANTLDTQAALDTQGSLDAQIGLDAQGGGLDSADGGASDDAADGQPRVVAGEFGSPCAKPSDCNSGLCVDDANGKVCGKLCTGGCPSGWTCATLQAGNSDAQSVCVPTFAHLCDPCAIADDCNPPGVAGGLCLGSGPKGTDGSFCAMICTPGEVDPCPTGYSCKSADGGFACLPDAGVCACSKSASTKELQTVCSVTTEAGTCAGVRSCKGGTLSSCTAGAAGAETCNGLDDDCDGMTDEMDGAPCKKKNEFGTCFGKITGCNGATVVCSAAEPAPENCNGLDDDCDGETDEGLCDDGNPCTIGTCNTDGSCNQQSASGQPCDDGNTCTQKDFCGKGQCQGGDLKTCDDGNPCTVDSCDPIKGCFSVNAAPGTTCPDDGVACTQDVCLADQCTHPSAKVGSACADDGDPCTSDVCDGAGFCNHPVALGFCKIGAQCVQAGAVNPADPCAVCDPAVTTATWVPKDGLACSDGDACTTGDKCLAGTCAGTPKSCTGLDTVCAIGQCDAATGGCVATPKAKGATCDDGNGCTNKDVCDGKGECAGTAITCAALTDDCNTGVCSNGQCLQQHKAAGLACSDGDACTVSDTCNGQGDCKGATKDCSALSTVCLQGVCLSGGCTTQPKPNGTVCNDNSTCTSNDKCTSGVCKGTDIKDSYEANNTSSAAKPLANKSDCDSPSSLTASMSPSGDVDWYTFDGTDNSGCTINPNVKLESLAADYDVCLYFACAGKTPDAGMVSCDAGTKTATGNGPNGSYGCCSSNTGTTGEFAKISATCSFLGAGSESGTLWIKVSPKSGAICGSYNLSWAAKNL